MKPILADIVRLADDRDLRTNGPIAIVARIAYASFVDLTFSPPPPWGPARKRAAS